MKQKRKLLAFFMTALMAWQGLSLSYAEEIGPGAALESNVTSENTTNTTESSGVPSEEDIRAQQAKEEEDKVKTATAIENTDTGKENGENAEATKAVSVNIIESSFLKEDGNLYDGSAISQNTNLKIKVRFLIPGEQKAKAGDKTVFKIPDSFSMSSQASFTLKNGEDAYAKGSYDSSSNSVTLSYESPGEKMADIQGEFMIPVQVNASAVKEKKEITGSLTVNGANSFPINGALHYTGTEKERDFQFVNEANKNLDEVIDPQTGNTVKLLRYHALINLGEARNNVTLKDILGEGAFSYYIDDAHPVTIRRGVWERGSFIAGAWKSDPINGKNWDLRNKTKTDGAERIHALEKAFTASAPGKKSFQLKLGNVFAGEGIELYYYVKFEGIPKGDFAYKNTLELSSDGGSPLIASSERYLEEFSGLKSEGYKLKIKMADEENQPLSGAMFAVANSSGLQVAVISSDANGEANLEGLPRDNYTVQEIKAPEGYLRSSDKYRINADQFDLTQVAFLNLSNVKAGQKRSISVNMKWSDAGNQAQGRPGKVIVELLQNGQGTGKTIELSQANAWKADFTELPKFDDNGKIYSYTIREQEIAGYSPAISGTASLGFTLTNTVNKKISIPVTKVWSGKGEHPSSVTVRLLANGKQIAYQQLSAANNWQYTFSNLERSKNGQEIRYTLTEDAVPGFSVTLTGDSSTGYVNVFTNTKLSNDPNNPGNQAAATANGGKPSAKPVEKKDKDKKENGSALGASREEKKDSKAKDGGVLGDSRDAEKEAEVTERNTKTGDSSRSLQYLLLFGAAACGFYAFFYQDKKEKERNG